MSLQRKAYGRLLLYLCATMAFAYLLQHSLAGGTLLEHNVYDSYALQAENWLAGRTWIAGGESYTWLELAVYQGRYYVSFPPVPSVLALPWVAAFGTAEAVPSNLLAALYGICTAAGVYLLFARRGAAPEHCAFWAALVCMGSNFWWLSTSGGVWFEAQVLNLCFVTWGLYFACGGKTAERTAAAFLLALAVGCRPFSILLLALFFLWLLKEQAAAPGRVFRRPGSGFWVPLLAAAAVGAALGWYNYIRFGSPLEFGHNYLPEFLAAPEGQFSFAYLLPNLLGLLRPVTLDSNLDLRFSLFNGFLFFAANPVFLVWGQHLFCCLKEKKLQRKDAVLCACWLLALLALCVHKTMGGWQFGARYLVDLIPYVLLAELPPGGKPRGKPRRKPPAKTECTVHPAPWEWMICIWAVLFNLYGAVYMLSHH